MAPASYQHASLSLFVAKKLEDTCRHLQMSACFAAKPNRTLKELVWALADSAGVVKKLGPMMRWPAGTL
jgi:hypothetical protein